MLSSCSGGFCCRMLPVVPRSYTAMTKGRQFFPSSSTDGTWFPHKGESEGQEGNGCSVTTPMFQSHISPGSHSKQPPFLFSHREKPFYRTSNPFSAHDNRHVIHGQAEYLGNGTSTRHFGRRLHPTDCRLHHTDVNFLHHSGPDSQHHYSPTTAATYADPGLLEPLTYRRFPRIYHNTESSPPNIPKVTGPEPAYRTPLHVLAITQQPITAHNDWKNSYRGDGRVYPPYYTKKRYSSLSPTGSPQTSAMQ